MMMKNVLFSIALLLSIQVSYCQQGGTISGSITDKSGAPLPGATVLLKATSQLTNAGSVGQYKLEKVSAGMASIVVSHIGYETVELPIMITEGAASILNVSLTVDEQI